MPEDPSGTNSDSGFDRVAPFYDALARLVFGNVLNEAQAAFLPVVMPEAKILIVGGGSGWLLEQILTTCAPRKVVYLEASGRMLHRARRRVREDGRVHFRHGTERSLLPDEQFDAVFTPFVLDLFSEKRLVGHLLPSLYAALRPGGKWFCTDFFRPDTAWKAFLLQSMYRFFRLTASIEARRLPDWPRLLEEELRLSRVADRLFWKGFIRSGVWEKAAVGFSVPLRTD